MYNSLDRYSIQPVKLWGVFTKVLITDKINETILPLISFIKSEFMAGGVTGIRLENAIYLTILGLLFFAAVHICIKFFHQRHYSSTFFRFKIS